MAAAALARHPEHGDRAQHLAFTSPDLEREGLASTREARGPPGCDGPNAVRRAPPSGPGARPCPWNPQHVAHVSPSVVRASGRVIRTSYGARLIRGDGRRPRSGEEPAGALDEL
ncbi:hypothetical protein [Streptomyces caniferus]|uniref:hypothetical protein n=1 Tax=Streptomyces caniferus TaxID=285557 RepID=UPI003F4D572A